MRSEQEQIAQQARDHFGGANEARVQAHEKASTALASQVLSEELERGRRHVEQLKKGGSR
jgi:hypothetical protein